ncbi:MAG: hypothetical protein ABSF22_05980 [Bryobacteraceae bacterium]|jgi:hypothetical protein
MNPTTMLFMLVFAAVMIIFIILISRYYARELEHKETLAALEKGVAVPVRPSAPWTPRTYLLHGMIWLFAGLTSFVALFAIAVTSNQPPSVELKLREVSNARAGGATPEEVQMLLNDQRGQGLPVGIGFLGLIPVGVGLAYLIFYRIESKKLLS